MIEDVSCIRFKPQQEVQHKDHIEFLAGRGCYSQVGRSGYGKQEIFLRKECAKVGIHLILHEVSHTVSTSDRELRMQHSIFIDSSFEYYFRSSTRSDFTTSISGLIGINISK